MTLISSRLTFIYKYILSLVLFGIVITTIIVTYNDVAINTGTLLHLIIVLYFGFLGFQLIIIKKVSYNNESLIVSDFITETSFPLKDIIEIRRHFLLFYVMDIQHGDKRIRIKYLCPAHESIGNSFGKTESVLLLEQKLKELAE